MANTPLERITRLLSRIGTPGAFASVRTVKPDDLRIEVYGVGRLRLPISAATARRLCEVARPAQHGYKDQTRLDPSVRDAWEIPPELITIDEPRWNRTLVPQLDRLRSGLGLPDACRLQAELHNLLVYAPGQFFVMHQDSEKTDDMIGTLVVNLPSSFTGGTLVIAHHDEKRRFGGSATDLSLIAFYADCQHEIQPVRSGYRVVLTYNLVVEGDACTAADPATAAGELAREVRRYFETPLPPRWSGDSREGPPDRLVYLLDHEYTQRGLAWERLKNADAVRAAALREVARQLDCEVFLALADVHEQWSSEDDGYGYGHYREWDEDEDEGDEEEDESSGTPELTDLLESSVELRHWVGPGERPQDIASDVDERELCYTKPSVELKPFKSEHEGYMGNYGNTVDRWYHRSAVVLWPRERTFVIRAKASARWAIGEVAKTLRQHKDEARALAKRLLPFWAVSVGRETAPTLFSTTLKTAAQLEDPALAAALLQPFPLTRLTPKTVPLLVELLERYGEPWCRALLKHESSEHRPYEPSDTRLSWMEATLPALCRGLCAAVAADGPALAHWLLVQQWRWMAAYLKEIRKHLRPKDLPSVLSPACGPLLALIESSRIAEQPELHAQIIEYLIDDAGLPLEQRLGLLREAHERVAAEVLPDLGLAPVHAQCAQALAGRLKAPARAAGDWSITAPVSCPRELSSTLLPFLRDPDRVRLEWPLAEAGRSQVHNLIEAHDLPVRHSTRRSGRPYTLILEKTPALFERDAADRRLWQAGLQWLTDSAADFGVL